MSIQEDRELLEMAAKAGGIRFNVSRDTPSGWMLATSTEAPDGSVVENAIWRPLTDDGDAFRLANQLNFWIERGTEPGVHVAQASWSGEIKENYASHDGDKDSATRRAIVRAAAEIGRSMP